VVFDLVIQTIVQFTIFWSNWKGYVRCACKIM